MISVDFGVAWMHSRFGHIGIVVAVTIIVLFSWLGAAPLWDEDEPRNAGCAAEMLERGDWVVPWFNGELRTHKPVMLYWLMMSAYSLFGVNEFSARFWSAVLGTGTVLLTYLIGVRLFDAKRGLLAALVLASTITPVMLSRAATPDAVLIFLLTLAIAIYVVAVTGKTGSSRMVVDYPSDRRVLSLMYGVMGLAVLAKGPIGLVLPTAIIGMFLLVRRLPERSGDAVSSSRIFAWVAACLRPFHPGHFVKTCLAMKPVTATLACLVVALPWYVVVTLRTDGEWTRGFFLDHNVGRFAQSMEHHGGPIIYYPLVMCAGFFPWSVFFIPLGLDLAQRLKQPDDAHASRIFCLCWVGVVVGLFSLAGTKLPSYVAPCYPGLALLMADFAVRLAEGKSSLRMCWPRFSIGTLIAVGVALTVGLVFLARHFSPGDELVAIVALPLIAGGIVSWMLLRSRPQFAIGTFAVTAIVFTAGLLGPAAARIGQRQQIASLMNTVNSLSSAPELRAAGAFRSSWVFYAGHPVREDHVSRLSPFLAQDADHFAITTLADLDTLETPLPAGVDVLAEIPFFTRPDKTLVLLGRASSHEQTVTRPTDTSGTRIR